MDIQIKKSKSSKKTDEIKIKTTSDFHPMISIIFWNSLGFFFFMFLIPYATSQLMEASGTQMGFTFASQTMGGLISAPIVGWATDRFSKKALVLMGSFGRGVCYVLMYIGIIFSSLIIFAIGLFVQGFFVGFFWSPLDALISEKSNKYNRSFAFGKRGGMMGWGNFLGSVISVGIFFLAKVFVPNNLFLVYSPLLIFTASNFYAGVIFNKNVDENLSYENFIKENHPNLQHELLDISLDEDLEKIQNSQKKSSNSLTVAFFFGFIILMLAFMTSNINQSLAQPFFQVYLIDVLKVENAVIVMLIYFPSQILSLLLAPKMGEIADRINPILGIAIVSGGGALVTWFIINSFNGLIFAIILTLDATFAWAGMLILQNVLSRISRQHRGKVFGTKQWISLLGGIIGPIIGGFAWDFLGPQSPFIISILIELSVIPLYTIAILSLKPYMAEKV
jgi:MFS family permease